MPPCVLKQSPPEPEDVWATKSLAVLPTNKGDASTLVPTFTLPLSLNKALQPVNSNGEQSLQDY